MENNESPELIEEQMQETRNSLTEKVVKLEEQVMGKMQSASDAVQSTVDAVKDTVENVRSSMEDTASSVKDNVQQALDFSRHIRENPWLMLGASLATGFVAGRMIGGSRHSHGEREFRPFLPAQPQPAPAAAPKTPSWMDRLLERAGDELYKLGETALDQAVASLRHSVNQNVPRLVDELEAKVGLGGEHRSDDFETRRVG